MVGLTSTTRCEEVGTSRAILSSPDTPVKRRHYGAHEETRAGERSRTLAAQQTLPQPGLGVGLEGGVVELDGELFTVAWCALAYQWGRPGRYTPPLDFVNPH